MNFSTSNIRTSIMLLPLLVISGCQHAVYMMPTPVAMNRENMIHLQPRLKAKKAVQSLSVMRQTDYRLAPGRVASIPAILIRISAWGSPMCG